MARDERVQRVAEQTVPAVPTAASKAPVGLLGPTILILAGATMASSSMSALNTALPAMSQQFSASPAEIAWVVLINGLASAALLTVFGRLSDMTGRKRPYAVGLVLYAASSALCGLSDNLPELVAFRLVQGIGGALIMANSVAYLVDIYPRDRRGFVFGTWEACIAIGLGIGPVIGGFLLSRWGWPPIFYVNLPFSLVMLAALPRVMVEPQRPKARQSFDFLGAGCFVLALAPFMYAVTLGGDAGWTSPVIVGCFAASLLGLVGFLVAEQRVPFPMVQLSMFHGRGFSAGNLAKVCGYFGLGATLFLLPFYLASELGLEAQVMGYTLAAFPVGMLVGSVVSGPLSDRLGTRLLGPGGLVLLAVSAGIQAQMTPAQGYTLVLIASLLAGLGVGTFIPPNDSAILSTTPPEKVGVANGIMGVSRSLGSMFGQSVIAGLLTVQLAATGGDFLRSYHDAFVVVAIITLVGAVLATVRDRRNSL